MNETTVTTSADTQGRERGDGMRYAYGVFAFMIWIFVLCWLDTQGCKPSADTTFLSTAIVVAGAMAGGD